MMAVAVTSSAGTLEVAAPIALFDSPYSNIFHTGVRAGAGPYHAFAVSADGQRFLIAQAIGDTSIPAPLVVVMNWAAALKS